MPSVGSRVSPAAGPSGVEGAAAAPAAGCCCMNIGAGERGGVGAGVVTVAGAPTNTSNLSDL